MKITIAEHLQPFSHEPGTSCAIPLSSWKVEVSPCLLRFAQDSTLQKKEIFLSIKGPVKEFTVTQDLEKGRLIVFGFSQDGYFRYVISQEEEGIVLRFERAPSTGILVKELLCKGKEHIVLFLSKKDTDVKLSSEKLSMGMHKSQDWPMVQRRRDFAEIFPVWLRLGQVLPVLPESKQKKGALVLLDECEALIQAEKRTEILSSFLKLFLAGFSGILSPRLQDEDHQGILPEETGLDEKNSLLLLTRGSQLIRSLFFQEEGSCFSLLPCLPTEFHAGRFVRIQTIDGDIIDLEWSKKLLRRAVLRIEKKKTITLHLQSAHKAFRLRRSFKEKGKMLSKEDPIECKGNDVLFLDRFQK